MKTTRTRATPTDVRQLKADPRNARKHDDRNVDAIAAALDEVGAGRSIVIDERGVVLAGNATIAAAKKAGITKLQVVDTDGKTLVAHRRVGLTQKEKIRLALFDNRTGELAEWAPDVLRQLQADGVSFDDLFTEAELLALLALPDGADAGATLQDRFGIPPFTVLDARQGYWQDRKRAWLSLGIESELGRGDTGAPGRNARPAMQQPKKGKTIKGDGRGRAIRRR